MMLLTTWRLLAGFSLTLFITCLGAAPDSSVQYLADVQDRFHESLAVYIDANSPGNHFEARGKLNSSGDKDAVPSMLESWTDRPHSGITCIRASFLSTRGLWGGWYMMNGVLGGIDQAPSENWGTVPNAGIDLVGATELTFWARGEKGGEQVEFFALGIGRDADTGAPMAPFPGSSPKMSADSLSLTTEWQQYRIGLQGVDLQYVLGGFGWVAVAVNNGNQDVVFYLDDIHYDKPRLDQPRFLVSYETIQSDNSFDEVLRNTAFTYDNAVALQAFRADGMFERAKTIADALVYAQEHDRFYDDGRIRNAYKAGDLWLPAGWTPNGRTGTVAMTGWYDSTANAWLEDEFAVSTHTGNVAWAMLALLSYYEIAGGEEYLQAAIRMGNWVESHCRDSRGEGGYTAGYEGWEPSPSKLLYKSTEHNLDLSSAFRRLGDATGNETWLLRAQHAEQFLDQMWDEVEGKFWTGTDVDGITINRDVIPLDGQSWGVLALGRLDGRYWEALAYAEANLSVDEGFDFNQDRDGIWNEGTAQMALAFQLVRQTPRSDSLVSFLRSQQHPSGGIYAADRDGLTTGFDLPDGQPWLYFRRLHIGATAWLAVAENSFNPFSVGGALAAPSTILALTSGATFEEGVAPGGIFTVFVAGLDSTEATASSLPLPQVLNDVTMRINGLPVPLFYVGPTQLNGQVPYETEVASAIAVVEFGGAVSAPFEFQLRATAPGFFQYTGHCVAQNADDYSLNTAQNPIRPGSILVTYLTGIGPIEPSVPTGYPAPLDTLVRAQMQASFQLGGQATGLDFYGLAPGWVGVAQANIPISQGLPAGLYNLEVSFAGHSSSCEVAVGTAALNEAPVLMDRQ